MTYWTNFCVLSFKCALRQLCPVAIFKMGKASNNSNRALSQLSSNYVNIQPYCRTTMPNSNGQIIMSNNRLIWRYSVNSELFGLYETAQWNIGNI